MIVPALVDWKMLWLLQTTEEVMLHLLWVTEEMPRHGAVLSDSPRVCFFEFSDNFPQAKEAAHVDSEIHCPDIRFKFCTC